MNYQHYVEIHHNRINEFVEISNFMLLVSKQTFDAPQIPESSEYMHVMLIFH